MAGLLSVALLPIGLLAIVQTQNLAAKSQSNAEMALLALTEQAASRERQALSAAWGASEALAATVPTVLDDVGRCSAVMMDLVEKSERFSFIGFIPLEGDITCSSAGRPIGSTLIDSVTLDRVRDGIPAVVLNTEPIVSAVPVLIVYTPVMDADEYIGLLAISTPVSQFEDHDPDPAEDALISLLTFNHLGDVLSVATFGDAVPDDVPGLMPQDRNLTDLLAGQKLALSLRDMTGGKRIYTVSTIAAGEVYVLGIWDASAGLVTQTRGDIVTSLFPALMWLAGLAVAMYAVQRLVVRHLQVLGRQMALFTVARRLPDSDALQSPPTEVLRIQRAFFRLTDTVIHDEARLENAVREKSVLVKEIHHRVKNNLQLISSIINMQVRAATAPEAKTALRQTQDRVLSMATIHRDLYQTNESGLVDVGNLVREVVLKTVEITPEAEGLDVKLNVDDVWLFPDQAVPMSLLAAEAVVNALKHMPLMAEGGVAPKLIVTLTRDLDTRACLFEAENTIAGTPGRQKSGPGGMGRKLIRAFATQLGAKVDTTQEDNRYILRVAFTASEFAPGPGSF